MKLLKNMHRKYKRLIVLQLVLIRVREAIPLPHTRRVQGFMETEDAQINYKDEKAMKIKAATQSYSFLFSFP